MLLIAIFEAMKTSGLSEKTRKLVWSFVEDQKTIDELNLQDLLTALREKIEIEVDVRRR